MTNSCKKIVGKRICRPPKEKEQLTYSPITLRDVEIAFFVYCANSFSLKNLVGIQRVQKRFCCSNFCWKMLRNVSSKLPNGWLKRCRDKSKHSSVLNMHSLIFCLMTVASYPPMLIAIGLAERNMKRNQRMLIAIYSRSDQLRKFRLAYPSIYANRFPSFQGQLIKLQIIITHRWGCFGAETVHRRYVYPFYQPNFKIWH
uniref:Uncharacterized protein n=1 Tax=Globodera rostochiensis TaxID=31243 RepID=A0A914IDL8_GLORO